MYRYANFELRSDFELDGNTATEPISNNSYALPDEYLHYLRLDRVGNKVAAYVSSNGVKWLYLSRKQLKLPDKVKVGVAAVNSAKEPLKTRFSDFGTAHLDAASRPVTVKPLTKEEQDKLLAMRVHGGIDATFQRFSSLFPLSSRIELPYGVAVMTSSPILAKAKLELVFPGSYMPTLREYLDAVALQSSSAWKYDPTGKFYKSEVDNGPAENLAMFEFTETKRPKPFKIELAKGWKAMRKGGRTIFLSSDGSGRLDIVQHGSYSPRDGQDEKDLLKRVVAELSLEGAKQFNPGARREDLSEANVGDHSALFFETSKTLSDGGEWRWRQWFFSVDNRCFLADAVMQEQSKERIGDDIKEMLKSLQIEKAGPAKADK